MRLKTFSVSDTQEFKQKYKSGINCKKSPAFLLENFMEKSRAKIPIFKVKIYKKNLSSTL